MLPVLFANLLWIIACSLYCILYLAQSRVDRAKGADSKNSFQRRVTAADMAAEYQ